MHILYNKERIGMTTFHSWQAGLLDLCYEKILITKY